MGEHHRGGHEQFLGRLQRRVAGFGTRQQRTAEGQLMAAQDPPGRW